MAPRSVDKCAYSDGVHASQTRDRRTSAENKHGRHNDVGSEPISRLVVFVRSGHVNVPKEHEYEMRYGSPSRSNDFQPCVGVRGVHLEFCGELFIA